MITNPNKPLEAFTAEDALSAKKQGLLKQWVEEFLDAEGNHGLATALKTEKAIEIDVINFPLELLNRIQGPELVENREKIPVWDDRVSKLQTKLIDGHNLPPLIVTDFWNPFEIVDGNHRHEALVKNGIKKHWTIFFIKHPESKKYLDYILKTYED